MMLFRVFATAAMLVFACGGAFAEKTMNADVVVVGGGLAGMSAGLTAVEGGAKVIIFEKLPGLGGAGNYPEGSLGIGTLIQKAESKGFRTPLDAFNKVAEFTHWRVDSHVLMELIKQSGETINWVQSEGVAFKGLKTVFPPEKTLWTWHIYQKNGASVIKNFYKKILAKGGQIYTETPVLKLLTNKKGEVTGVEAKDLVTGEVIKVNAKGVIIATGGFANNKEMIHEYVTDVKAPGMVDVKLRGPLLDGRTGDGINMALAVGAQLTGMQTIAGNSPYVNQDPPIRQFNGADYQKQARTALSQPFLWINRDGVRFYNESAGSNFSDVYNAMTMNGGMMYSVFDDEMRKKMIKEGPVTPFNAIVVPGQPMKALDEAIEIGMKEGWLFKAKNLDDLAKQLKMDAAVLKNTVSTINKYAKGKDDLDFGRKTEHLFTFSDKGPYYAVMGIRAYFLTLGGVKINKNFEALDNNNKPIKGLYVVGQDMGGLYDSSYDLLLEGSASGFALTSGRMAAKNIISHRLNK